MFRRLIAVLLLIPLVDVVLLAFVAAEIGWVGTVAIVVLTALLGMLFARAEGRRTIRKLQRAVAQGEPPQDELVEGGLLIAAGAFLLTPGLITDAVGFVLVVPPTRALVRRLLMRYVLVPYVDERTGGFATGSVYVGGFPQDEETTVDLGDEDYDVED